MTVFWPCGCSIWRIYDRSSEVCLIEGFAMGWNYKLGHAVMYSLLFSCGSILVSHYLICTFFFGVAYWQN